MCCLCSTLTRLFLLLIFIFKSEAGPWPLRWRLLLRPPQQIPEQPHGWPALPPRWAAERRQRRRCCKLHAVPKRDDRWVFNSACTPVSSLIWELQRVLDTFPLIWPSSPSPRSLYYDLPPDRGAVRFDRQLSEPPPRWPAGQCRKPSGSEDHPQQSGTPGGRGRPPRTQWRLLQHANQVPGEAAILIKGVVCAELKFQWFPPSANSTGTGWNSSLVKS